MPRFLFLVLVSMLALPAKAAYFLPDGYVTATGRLVLAHHRLNLVVFENTPNELTLTVLQPRSSDRAALWVARIGPLIGEEVAICGRLNSKKLLLSGETIKGIVPDRRQPSFGSKVVSINLDCP